MSKESVNYTALIAAAIVCVSLVAIALILRPARYRVAGPHNNLILDTENGVMPFPSGRAVENNYGSGIMKP